MSNCKNRLGPYRNQISDHLCNIYIITAIERRNRCTPTVNPPMKVMVRFEEAAHFLWGRFCGLVIPYQDIQHTKEGVIP